MTRVVVTGMGALTPIGNDVASFQAGLNSQKVGFEPISYFDASATGVTLAGQIDDFAPLKYLSKKDSRRMDKFTQYAMYATAQAVQEAGISEDNTDSERFGVIWGSGIGGLTTIQEQVIKWHEKGLDRVSPMFIPTSIANMAAGNISIRYHAKAISTTIVTACTSATNAIGEAFRQIKNGYADVMITGGSESAINESGIAGFAAISTLATATDPYKASIPFDQDRSGFVMGEGAGSLVLESLEHAESRGAKILGEIIGYGVSSDAYHITSPDPSGKEAARAMKMALDEGGISPQQVGYINAHGTSTKTNDSAESKAINQVFGQDSNVLVSSTKSMTGHLLGAAGAVEAVATILALETGQLPVNVGLNKQDPECQIRLVTKSNCKRQVDYAISNSFGFGGHNGVIAMKRWGS